MGQQISVINPIRVHLAEFGRNLRSKKSPPKLSAGRICLAFAVTLTTLIFVFFEDAPRDRHRSRR
jgi:hypothetical protein